MEKSQLSESEKQLLTVLGKYPGISIKELVTHTTYKWTSTIVRKINQFKEQSILWGPAYDVNYDRLCKNPLHKLFCILELTQSWETVIPYLLSIEPVAWIFPVLSPHKEFLLAGFYSTNDLETEAIFNLLKGEDIITDYIIRCYTTKRMIENPDFFGDPSPSMDQLLDPCTVPDISLAHHDTDWNECDIRVLPYLAMSKGLRLIEILRAEKKLNKTWTYAQVNYSREKMLKNGLIEKKFIILPFHVSQCAYFFLSLKTEDTDVTQRILCNFARKERVYKEYLLCGEWGVLFCISHSAFLTELMYKLDKIKEITEKELHLLRFSQMSNPVSNPPLSKYFDFEKQTLEYPYHVYKEKIKEKIESGVEDWDIDRYEYRY